MRIFLSYKFSDEAFVHRVNYYLRRQPGIESFCYAGDRHDASWYPLVLQKLNASDKFVLFCNPQFQSADKEQARRALGNTQATEATQFFQNKGANASDVVVVLLHDSQENEAGRPLSDDAKAFFSNNPARVPVAISIDRPDHVARPNDDQAQQCARKILALLDPNATWIEDDGLPIGYPFDYEKDIIDEFYAGHGYLVSPKRLEQGCPIRWPEVPKRPPTLDPNPLPEEEIGTYRPDSAQVIVDVRSLYHNHEKVEQCPFRMKLTFREAGPRRWLCFPPEDELHIGIVVSGGIAPGINAVIAGLVERHVLYYEKGCQRKNMQAYPKPGVSRLDIVLYQDGLEGIGKDKRLNLTLEDLRQRIAEGADLGGSMIGTSRYDDLITRPGNKDRDKELEGIVNNLNGKIDILYVIGGDGTMRAAHAIHRTAKRMGCNVSVVAIPKTMDNDILWVWQSFGFLTAVERAKQSITQLQAEVKSNPRLCIIQLFGSDSGFVVSHAALASGSCDGALIPEAGFQMKDLSHHIQNRLYRRHAESGNQRTYGTVLLAETAIPLDAEDYLDDPEVGLEESEKREIRRFLGSPLLNVDDIVNWGDFCKALNKNDGQYKAALQRIRNSLPKEVMAIVKTVAQGPEPAWDQQAMMATVVKALNMRVIGGPAQGEDTFAEGITAPGDAKLIRYLMEAAKAADSDEKLDAVFFVMEGLHLAHEAFVTRTKSERLKDDLQKIKRDLDSLVKDPAIDIIRKELEEKQRAVELALQELREQAREKLPLIMGKSLNRILLEEVLKGHIRPLSLCPGDGRVHGQTPDELRTGGLKIVSRVLKRDIRNAEALARPVATYKDYCSKFRVFTNEPRHLLRAISPSASDVVFGHRLGVLAVDNAMAGYTDFLVSQWITEYVLIPLELVVLGRKRIPPDGIFWKSVLAKTDTAEMFK